MAKKKAKGSKYNAYIIIAGKSFSADGDTVADAIGSLAPTLTKGRAVLTLSHEGKRRERLLMPQQVYRLFNTHGLVRDILVKNTATLFDNL